MATPPLPPGFQLEDASQAPQPASQSVPALPAGFVLEGSQPLPITNLPPVQADRPDFSGVTATVDSTAFDNAPDGWKYGAGRDAAFGLRSALQGVGGLVGAVGGDAFNNYIANPVARAVGLQEARPYREEAQALADRLGLPKAQTSRDRVLGDVGEALAGTALTMGAGAGANALANVGRQGAAPAVSRVGQFLTAQPALQTISAAGGSAASSATKEAGGSERNQLLAGLAGGLGPSALGGGVAAGLRGLVRGRSGAEMQNRLADFAALGTTPSVGQASGNSMVQGAENLLAGGPTSAGVMNRFASAQAEDIGEGLQQTANTFNQNASAEKAGRAIERGIEAFGRNVGAMKRALYWQADRFIPETTPVGLGNTMQVAQKLTTPSAGAAATTGSLVNPRIAALQQNLAADLQAGGGQIPYAALKRIRTDIGEQINDFSMTADTPTRELKQLYAALSRDMEAAAQSMGPQAVAAAKRANNYTRAAAERLEQVQRVIDKNGGPEAVYNAAMAGTRDGGTTLRAVMQSLPKDGQEAVTAAVIKRMGLATPGAQDATGEAFSAANFLTNWNRVSPEAKRALFDRHGAGFSQSMGRIAQVVDNIKSGAKVFANPSGTANRGAAMSYGIGLPISVAQAPFTGQYWPVVATIGGGIGANIAARAFTSPLVVNWLAHSTRLPTGAINASIQGLTRAAEKSGDSAAMEYAAALAAKQSEGSQQQGAGGDQNQPARTP